MTSTQEFLLRTFPDGGFFVEAGAHDGVGDSQTLALEQAGWHGLCVEPSSAFAGLKASRRCKVDGRVLWRSTGMVVTFREMAGERGELSGIVQTFGDDWDRESHPHEDRKVITMSLVDLLREHEAPAKVEFLCLDTEGSEFDILGMHDFKQFRFLTLLVEHNGNVQNRMWTKDLLESKGCVRLWDDGTNGFFADASLVEAGK